MKNILFLAGVFLWLSVAAQPPPGPDSTKAGLPGADTVIKITDTIQQQLAPDSLHPVLKQAFTSDSFLYRKRLFFSFTNPVYYTVSEKQWEGKDAVFYSIVALLLLFAALKNAFRNYLSDLFSTYFRTTVRQKQIKEQLLQNPLSSLVFNLFFIVSTALFLSLMFQHFHLGGTYSFALLTAYSAGILIAVYVGKLLLLKFIGWVFQVQEATDTYIFILFSTNKILGVILLPFIVLLAFTYSAVNAATVTVSFIMIAALLTYHYFLSYISVNRMAGMQFLHFLLYFTAVEILPLLLINKLLFPFLSEIS